MSKGKENAINAIVAGGTHMTNDDGKENDVSSWPEEYINTYSEYGLITAKVKVDSSSGEREVKYYLNVEKL